jgi:MoxR-like ATPase
MKQKSHSFLQNIGVFGFDKQEPLILAALISQDPMLMIGRSGTGKTFLLNSLSEALDLEHRHYNASLISFDDLVGFPFPDQAAGTVRFLETPATIWSAESVLIDEISRCKPEHQNRLFSIVHERRVQGIALKNLRFRWAAMNPCSTDQDDGEDYTGSQALDPALADRFGMFIHAGEWSDFTDQEQRFVAHPGGEGLASPTSPDLQRSLIAWRAEFEQQVMQPPEVIWAYTTAVVGHLNAAKVRISPRRARMLSRSLVATGIVAGGMTEALFRQVLEASLPHVAWGAAPAKEVVRAAHRAAWDAAKSQEGAWIHGFLAAQSVKSKVQLLTEKCKKPDEGSQAVAQLIACEPSERAHAFAFTVYPAALAGVLPIGAEGVHDLARLATAMYTVNGEISWQERHNTAGSTHPEIVAFAKVLSALKGARRERAEQFFNWCLVQKVVVKAPQELEAEINDAVRFLATLSKAKNAAD